MRGKEFFRESSHARSRITPAYAGKSLARKSLIGSMTDHPRLCGEKHRSLSHQYAQAGSPPPMRGKAAVYDALFTDARITPAYAGKR